MAADPERALRRMVSAGPARKLVTAGFRVLPTSVRPSVRERLFGPATRRRGHTHLPGPGASPFSAKPGHDRLGQGAAKLGYAPAFSFEEGMVPTARYLKEYYQGGVIASWIRKGRVDAMNMLFGRTLPNRPMPKGNSRWTFSC